jgi:subtilisin family serine protease
MANPDDRPVIQAVKRAVNHAHSRGSVVLAESFAPPFMPGIDADADGTAVIVPAQTGSTVVGASGPEDQWSRISNFGFTLVDVAAPGGWVDPVTKVPPMSAAIIGPCSRFTQFGTLPTICNQSAPARYLFIVGSKPATAHAAGVSALIASRFPNLPGAAIRARLLQTADDIGDPGRDPFFGHGRVNALRAVPE